MSQHPPVSRAVLVALTVVLGVAGFGALRLQEHARTSYEHHDSPYARELLPARQTPQLTSRVVLIVSDGLRYDAASNLPNISKLAHRPDGVLHRSVTQVPSLSLPGWTAILTGVRPEASGVVTNAYEPGPVPVESILQTAGDAGLTPVVGGASNEWQMLFAGQAEFVLGPFPENRGPEGDAISDPLVEQAFGRGAPLTVLYYPAVDDTSHYKGTFSPDAVAAMRGLDERVGRIASRMDLSRETLIVTSDHGHVDEGGHGGYESDARRSPLLMVGSGVHPAPPLEVSQLDIAPTVAALLGIARPRQAEGMPVLGSMSATSETIEYIRAVHDAALRARLRSDLEVVGGEPVDAEAVVLRDQIDSAGWRRGVTEAIDRVPVSLLLLAFFCVIARLAGGLRWRSMLAALVVLLSLGLAIASTGFRLSISYFNTPGSDAALDTSVLLGIIFGSALGGVILGAGRKGEAWRGAVALASASALLGSAVSAAFLIYYGPTTSWRLPDLRLGFIFFFAAYVVVLVVPMIPVIALMAHLAGRVRPGEPAAGLAAESGDEPDSDAAGGPDGGGNDTRDEVRQGSGSEPVSKAGDPGGQEEESE